MLIYDGLAVIGATVSIAFCGFCVLMGYKNLQQFEEVERKDSPEVYDIPNWNQMNPVAKNANKELKKMYKGKMKGELV